MSTSDLEEFKKQMMESVQNTQKPRNEQNVIQVQKNLLLGYVSDAAGCGHIRTIFPMTYVNSIYAKTGQLMTIVSPVFIWQHDILLRTRAIFFQRQMSPGHLETIKKYKEIQPNYKFKMVWDMDDFIWGRNEEQGGTVEDGVPSYNFGSQGITEEIVKSSIEIIKLMDAVTVSTQFLADYIRNKFGIKNIFVVPNAVPAFFWGNRRRAPIRQYLEKPRVIYTGSPTHYLNPIAPRNPSPEEPTGFPGNPKCKLGDFDNAWREWIIKSVNSGRIEFICLGGLPWFFNSIKDKITVVNWVDSFNYHNTVINMRPDFGIMPLVKNNFNKGKSNIKEQELCAVGALAIGSYFDDENAQVNQGPYCNCEAKISYKATVEDIDKMFDKLCEPDTYNSIISKQYDNMLKNGWYLESKEYIDKFIIPFI